MLQGYEARFTFADRVYGPDPDPSKRPGCLAVPERGAREAVACGEGSPREGWGRGRPPSSPRHTHPPLLLALALAARVQQTVQPGSSAQRDRIQLVGQPLFADPVDP
jgi:hypothetical protein